MRGRTLKNSFAILDEAQNATDTQIKMFLTRIGENSKIVINGDPSQIDLPNKSLSGLNRSKKLLGHLNEISVVDFDHSDVVRHPLVSKIVKAYSTVMIKVNVLSEIILGLKLKKKKFFYNNICRYFPKKFKFINQKVYFTLLLSNNRNIKKLNKIFRNKNKHTDILSFPFHKNLKNKEIYLGDMIIYLYVLFLFLNILFNFLIFLLFEVMIKINFFD